MTKIVKPVGCEACPRNNVKGINKIIGEVLGKRIMLWVQSPGVDENRVKKELVGRAAQWLWKELSRIGIQREDCDIQNVVRCAPMDRDEIGYWELRDPSKDEVKACSYWTKIALEKQRAKIWLVFGKFAKEALFGKSKAPGAAFYQEDGSRVFILDHPAYFLRGAPSERLEQFRNLLDMVKETLSGQVKDKFDCYKDVTIDLVTTGGKAVSAAKNILRMAGDGNRIAYDAEYDRIAGEEQLLLVGALGEPGFAHIFVLDHPENTASLKDRQAVRTVLSKLIAQFRFNISIA